MKNTFYADYEDNIDFNLRWKIYLKNAQESIDFTDMNIIRFAFLTKDEKVYLTEDKKKKFLEQKELQIKLLESRNINGKKHLSYKILFEKPDDRSWFNMWAEPKIENKPKTVKGPYNLTYNKIISLKFKPNLSKALPASVIGAIVGDDASRMDLTDSRKP